MVKSVLATVLIYMTKVIIFLFGTDNYILELQYTNIQYISRYALTIITHHYSAHYIHVRGAEHLKENWIKLYFQSEISDSCVRESLSLQELVGWQPAVLNFDQIIEMLSNFVEYQDTS